MRELDFIESHQHEVQERATREYPATPIITTWESTENVYEASFALRLEGISTGYSPDNRTQLTPTLASMLPDQQLMICYSMVQDESGGLEFRMDIHGHVPGSNRRKAIERAKELWNNLEFTLGSCAPGYHFQPVPHDELDDTKEIWESHIEPKAVAVTRMFTSHSEPRNINTVLMPAPNVDPGVNGSVFAALLAHKTPVRLVFQITAMTLSDEQQSIVRTAIKSTAKGMTTRCDSESIEKSYLFDQGHRTNLEHEMEKWLRSPKGYRLDCRVDSKEEPTRAFLEIVASGIFAQAPVSIRTERSEGRAAVIASKSSIVSTLKLNNCIRSAIQLPTKFPDMGLLIRAGIPRHHLASANGLPNHDSGLLLGNVDEGSTKHEVRLHDADRSRHCYILGATGTGKSTLLYNMVSQDIDAGKGVCLMDPHGDLYDRVLNSIPKSRETELVLIDPCDFEYPVGINFLECPEENRALHKSLIANELLKILSILYDMKECGGPVFESYMRNAVMLAMDHPEGGTLLDVPLIFENKKYRKFLLNQCEDSYVKGFWLNQAEEVGGDHSLANLTPYITSKLNLFTNSALMRPIIGQRMGTINFRSLMDEGAIILVNLSKGVLGTLDSSLLGKLLMGKLFNAALSRSMVQEEARKPFYLYVDEFQNFTTDTVASLVSEARKFGLYLTLANQTLSQLETGQEQSGIRDAVLGNVGTMMFFRMGVRDSYLLDEYTKPELGANDLRQLADYHVATRMLYQTRLVPPFVFKTEPGMASNNQICADIDKLVSTSRDKYSRPASLVLKEQDDRRESFYTYVPPAAGDGEERNGGK